MQSKVGNSQIYEAGDQRYVKCLVDINIVLIAALERPRRQRKHTQDSMSALTNPTTTLIPSQ